jgi:DNA modification methylase
MDDNYLGPYLLGPNDENQGIYTGDARELARAIPDESVDLIFTDPVYQNIEDYRWLAETAARVLKPDSACLVWCGIGYLDTTIDALNGCNLQYKWLLPTLRPLGVRSAICMKNVFTNWRSLLWFEKGVHYPNGWISDVGYSNDGSNNLHHGKWDKSFNATLKWTSAFVGHDAITLDPFTGGGTVPAVCKMLGRRWLAFEIDPNTAEKARERVRMTQPPLFVMEPEQMELL